MIQSMTGYGNTTSGKGSNRFTISIKTVNARFLDIKFKGCDLEPNVEKEIRDIISAKLVRGTVFINFDQNLTSNDEASHFNEERFEMLSGSLSVNPKIRGILQGASVLLVDDVMTSGATLSVATKACLEANADQVNVIVLARVAKHP